MYLKSFTSLWLQLLFFMTGATPLALACAKPYKRPLPIQRRLAHVCPLAALLHLVCFGLRALPVSMSAHAPRSPKTRPPQALSCADPAEHIDVSLLRSLVGYNARRAALHIIGVFMERMQTYQLKVVEFSVLSLLAHNPGLTSRHVCSTLNIMPPNLVGLVAALEKRGLLERHPHPSDGRAMGLYLTAAGQALAQEAEQAVAQLEIDATAKLTANERKSLIRLLQKVYD